MENTYHIYIVKKAIFKLDFVGFSNTPSLGFEHVSCTSHGGSHENTKPHYYGVVVVYRSLSGLLQRRANGFAVHESWGNYREEVEPESDECLDSIGLVCDQDGGGDLKTSP